MEHSIDTTEQATGTQSPLIIIMSNLLYIFALVFQGISTLTIETTWTWTWRILSAFSLLLLIYINWDKAVEVFKKRKNGKRTKSN